MWQIHLFYYGIFLLLTEIMAGIMPGVSLLSKSHVSLLSRSLSTTSVSKVSWGFLVLPYISTRGPPVLRIRDVYPGSSGQKGTGSRIRIRNTAVH
jgi:hypothetical protein